MWDAGAGHAARGRSIQEVVMQTRTIEHFAGEVADAVAEGEE